MTTAAENQVLDQEIYFVKQDWGKNGFEAQINYDRCSRSQVIEDLIAGEYATAAGEQNVAGVFYINIAEGVSRDVTEDILNECFGCCIAAE